MKRISFLTLATIALISPLLFAGPPAPDYKQAPPMPVCDYGTGWYVALEGGANVFQNVDRTRERTFANGDVLEFNSDSNIGGYGGIKIGYVFGKGTFRPTIEEDMFYNGVSTDAKLLFNGNEIARSSNLINTGAFMTNFIARFAFGKFQPYAGAGVGAYYAAAAGSDVFTRNGRTFSTGGGNSSGSLAWDVVGGSDYYWSCKWSTFIEYHYLNYVALDVGEGNHHVGQHLVGGGLRFHF